MSFLWFDPRAEIVKHDPPRKPVDPSRPLRKKVTVTEPVQQAIGWPYFGVIYQAPETDPA